MFTGLKTPPYLTQRLTEKVPCSLYVSRLLFPPFTQHPNYDQIKARNLHFLRSITSDHFRALVSTIDMFYIQSPLRRQQHQFITLIQAASMGARGSSFYIRRPSTLFSLAGGSSSGLICEKCRSYCPRISFLSVVHVFIFAKRLYACSFCSRKRYLAIPCRCYLIKSVAAFTLTRPCCSKDSARFLVMSLWMRELCALLELSKSKN